MFNGKNQIDTICAHSIINQDDKSYFDNGFNQRSLEKFNRLKKEPMFNNNNGGGFTPRPMVEGNWKCSECGAEINKLPFEPAPDRPIYCRECWSKKKPSKFSR